VFGLESPDPLPTGPDPLPEGEYGHPWIEFRAGNCSLIVFKLDGDGSRPSPPPRHETWVFVDDLDAHYSRTAAAGATIVRGIAQTGFRAYTAEDLEGNRWTFAQARPRQT
jgi:predicted enzyme related to lactoylglutathione lyase